MRVCPHLFLVGVPLLLAGPACKEKPADSTTVPAVGAGTGTGTAVGTGTGTGAATGTGTGTGSATSLTEYGPLSGRVWGLVVGLDKVPLCRSQTTPPQFFLANGSDCGGGSLMPVVSFQHLTTTGELAVRAEDPGAMAPWRITATTEGTLEAGGSTPALDGVVGFALDSEVTIELDPTLILRFTMSDPGAPGAYTVDLASILAP